MSNERLNHLCSLLSNKFLELHILPTEQCNFRCTYCYEDFAIGKMPPKVVTGIKNLIDKRMPELEQLKIAWFGGEPLAAKNLIFDISRYAKEKAKEFNCKYNSGITTNGYLLNLETFNKLLQCGVNFFQISLDGPQQFHDKTRLRTNGTGTFTKIWENLVNLSKTDSDFTVMLRLHVTPENYKAIPTLIDNLKQNFKSDQRFKIFFKAIENLGGSNGGTFQTLSGKNRFEIIESLKAMIGDSFKQINISQDGFKDNLPHACYASTPNAYVIRANGTLAKCTVIFNDERNHIGHLNEDGTLHINQEKLMPWLRGIKNYDINTMVCPLRGLPKLANIS